MELIGKLVAYLADGQTRNLKCMKNLKRERERLTVFRAFDLTSKFKLINNYFQLQITQLTFIELDNLKAFSMVFFSSFSLSLSVSLLETPNSPTEATKFQVSTQQNSLAHSCDDQINLPTAIIFAHQTSPRIDVNSRIIATHTRKKVQSKKIRQRLQFC